MSNVRGLSLVANYPNPAHFAGRFTWLEGKTMHVVVIAVTAGLIVMTLGGCQSDTDGPWNDATGAGRGQAAFDMDSGRCHMYSEANTSTTDSPSYDGLSRTGKALTASGNVLQAIGSDAQRMSSYRNCMNAAGWVLGRARPPHPETTPYNSEAAKLYDVAFDYLKAKRYEEATAVFNDFVVKYPKDSLAASALYWQGQINFMQDQFDRAAIIFFDAYQHYPNSAKAGESLLKVGLSMSSLGKKKEACAALHRFKAEFPDAADNLKRLFSAETQKLGC